MATDMQEFIESTKYTADQIRDRTREIYETVLRDSKYVDNGNFTCIHPHDIERMFDLYNERFFNGYCRKLPKGVSLEFRLSKRMTQAGGKVGRREFRGRHGRPGKTEYEIAASTTLLFQTFQGDHRPVVMSGIECHDRLEALQRVMEHEMVHFVELLIWGDSSCSAPRYQSIANRFFGHTDHRHQLVTPRERALVKFGIKPGDRVSFRMDGRHRVGRVNRITKRATVLVEDAGGMPYSDGKCYAKFYVPLGMLETVKD